MCVCVGGVLLSRNDYVIITVCTCWDNVLTKATSARKRGWDYSLQHRIPDDRFCWVLSHDRPEVWKQMKYIVKVCCFNVLSAGPAWQEFRPNCVCNCQSFIGTQASIHWAGGRLTARSREVSKLRDSGLDFFKYIFLERKFVYFDYKFS